MEAHPGLVQVYNGATVEVCLGDMEAHPGALETHPGALKSHPGAIEAQPGPWRFILILGCSSWARGGHGVMGLILGPCRLTLEPFLLTLDPWRFIF
jgi:hypothetical protein